MTLRICLLTESFYPKIGGGETHARLLGTRLIRRGVSVFVLTQKQLRTWPRVDQVDGIPVHRVGPPGFARFGKFLMLPAALLTLLRRRHDYDVIYVCGFRTLGPVAVLVARLTGSRCVLRAESCAELSGADPIHQVRGGIRQNLVHALIGLRNRILLRADRFLSISEAIAEEFRSCGVPPERIVAIRNGIDTARFTPASGARKQELRRQLGLPDGFLCTYTGKLNRGKGLEMLLRAWRRLEHPALHLVLVGSGAHQFLSCEDELRTFVRTHDLEQRVTFTGAVRNVEDYLQASDLFVFPSESEALGISLIEAMACGLPVVATRTGGIPDVVDDGVNGCLIEVGDEEAFIRTVDSLFTDPSMRAELGQAARQKVLSSFGIDAIAAAHEELFRSLIERPTGVARPARS